MGADVRSPGGKPSRPRVVPSQTAFWLLAVVLAVLLFASAAPAPLYVVYQAEWRFSATTLTAVFAIYALALLVTLLFLGSLSDYLGRRPVIIAGLAIDAVACALFLVAHGVDLLFAARALQGVAVGLATGALGAALIELQPERGELGALVSSTAPTTGLAVGALSASALAQYAPAPTRLVWWLLLGAFVAAIIAVLAIPEPAPGRPGVLASLRPRVGVPRRARATFAVGVPCLIAVWALGGLYLSLGPSLAAQLVGSQNRLWGGLVIVLLTGIGAAAGVLFRAANPPTAMLTGCLALLVGALVTFVAIVTTTLAVFLVGTALAGVGFGLAFLGAFRTLVTLAAPAERSGLIAAIFIVSYLAFSVPAVIAGIATSHFGLHDTALVYSLVIAALVGATAGSLLLRTPVTSYGHEPHPAPADPANQPCTVPAGR